jgi:hypothetical protein
MNARIKRIIQKLMIVILGVKLSEWIFGDPRLWVEVAIAAIILVVIIVWEE